MTVPAASTAPDPAPHTATDPATGLSPAPATGSAPARIALVGTRGFGAVHLRNLARLEQAGLARLVGVVDVAEPPAELAALHHPSLADLLAALPEAERPEIVVIATPIGTHVPLATEALAAGADVYLEKPPVPALEDHWTLLAAAQQAGRSVQVGFQARGGAGVDVLRDEVAAGARDTAGALGPVTAVHVYGAWQRDRAYYARSAWAGKRRLDGRRVADGVATNPLAHSVHAGLAIAGIDRVEDIAGVTTELRRAHDIQADDTTFLLIDPVGDGPAVVCALTTTAAEQTSPWIEISGPGGSHRLYYTEDRSVRIAADGTREELSHQREDLTENLIAHVRDRQVPLRSSLASTGVFSAVLEAIQAVPDPLPIETEVTWEGDGEAAHPVVERIEEILRDALGAGRPFSELGVSWARQDAVHRWTPPAAP